MSVLQAARTAKMRFAIVSAGLWAICIIGLAIFQTWRTYSPVPVWDMWVGYLGFYEKTMDGSWRVWWSQHNEHRIFLNRLLFWADIRWFGGQSIFLLVADYVLLILIIIIFWRILWDRLSDSKFAVTRIFFGLFITGWAFLLCQGENLTWAFQGEFFSAFLLPICALYLLQKETRGVLTLKFVGACICGALAAGTLANGILTLPLMTVYAITVRQQITRIAILLVLTTVMILSYFHGYNAPGGHSLLAKEVIYNIKGAIYFLITFIGSPFYYISHNIIGRKCGLYVAQGFGIIFILSGIYKAAIIFPRFQEEPLQTALLFYNLYVLGTAVAVTGGRLFQGVDAALIAHYTTPALLGWAATAALYSKDIAALKRESRRWLALPALALALLVLIFQLQALTQYDGVIFERNVAILALALGVDDEDKIKSLTDPLDFKGIPPIAEKAYAHRLSLFGAFPFAGVRQGLGEQSPRSALSSLPTCHGEVSGIEATTDPRFAEIDGWLANSSGGSEPGIVRFLDESGKEVGYAIGGDARPNLTEQLGDAARRAGYSGYVFSSAVGKSVVLQGEDRTGALCRMNAPLPSSMMCSSGEVGPYDPIVEAATVGKEQPVAICEGNIDEINGKAPKQFGNMISGKLEIKGWMTVSGKSGIVPDAVFVRIQDPHGEVQYVKAHTFPRSDLQAFFAQPKLPDAGFVATIDPARLDGSYVIGISRISHGKLENCEQFKLPITMTTCKR